MLIVLQFRCMKILQNCEIHELYTGHAASVALSESLHISVCSAVCSWLCLNSYCFWTHISLCHHNLFTKSARVKASRLYRFMNLVERKWKVSCSNRVSTREKQTKINSKQILRSHCVSKYNTRRAASVVMEGLVQTWRMLLGGWAGWGANTTSRWGVSYQYSFPTSTREKTDDYMQFPKKSEVISSECVCFLFLRMQLLDIHI